MIGFERLREVGTAMLRGNRSRRCYMSKRSNLLWITGLLLGWAFDLLFWKQPMGINFALYSLLCVLGGCLVLLANQQAPARGTLLVFPLILLFAATTAIRAEPMTV